jgi:hypothetical protein
MSETLGVEEIETFKDESSGSRQAIAGLAIPKYCPGRSDAGVPDERSRTEMPHSQTAEEGKSRLDGHAGRDHPVRRAGNVWTGRITVVETRS